MSVFASGLGKGQSVAVGEQGQVLCNEVFDVGAKGNLQAPARGTYYLEAFGDGGGLHCTPSCYVDSGRAKVGGGRNPLESPSVDDKRGMICWLQYPRTFVMVKLSVTCSVKYWVSTPIEATLNDAC